MKNRYSFGGDEHLFVECSEEMSLNAFFKSLSLTNEIKKAVKNKTMVGVNEICPANASFQLKFDPDIIQPNDLLNQVKEIEKSSQEVEQKINTRTIEIPVFYNDPWTHETLMKFRDRHQDPESTDLEYAASINHYQTVKEFIEAHSSTPWFVTMVGFVSGLPFMYQMVEREKQIEVPKYLRPRTDTPKLTLGHGGCFSCIYSVRGAGGYQMFGIIPTPVYDPTRTVSYLKDFMVFFRPGDIVKFRAIDKAEYEQILRELEENKYQLKIKNVEFDLKKYTENKAAYCNNLVEGLSHD